MKPVNKQLAEQNKQLAEQNEQLTAQNEQLTAQSEQLTAQGKQLTALARAAGANAESAARALIAVRTLNGYWPQLTMSNGERRARASPSATARSKWMPCHAPACTWLRTVHACMQSACKVHMPAGLRA